MRLFIAEKPSMARELAKCLPAPQQKGRGFLTMGSDVVTWAYGHVLQQAEPQDYDEKYARWRSTDLPIVPTQWKLLVSPGSAEQFKIIGELIARADVIVNAGDPDREGQLLIDEILDYVGNTKPVQRILLNALDEKSIKESLGNLKDNKQFFPLKQAALARSRADWLIGMNLSRAYTLAARRWGYKVTFPIGRVKTPTLALVVRRQRELEHFVPAKYFNVKASFAHAQGLITAQWQPKDTQAGLDAEGRVVDEKVIQALWEKLTAQPDGKISARTKTKKKEPPRMPLSLSALQVLAGKRYGYDPQQVLDTAQALYERKLTTYPRSDCEYLPVNQFKDVPVIINNLKSLAAGKLSAWAEGADPKLKSRAWNDSKITAHHAIIPTTVRCDFNKLNSMQQHIYYLIAQAYLAQFYGFYEYDQTRIEIAAAEETFVAHGKVVTAAGWKELYGLEAAGEEAGEDEAREGSLPLVKKGDPALYREGTAEPKATKPPPRFTASTLLAAMKEIYKYVKDESLKKKLKEVQGIGTEATRATIISELIQRKFMVEEGKKKYLLPTPIAYLLVDALPDEMVYPDATAIWEERLYQMSEGKDALERFLQDQVVFLTTLVQKSLAARISLAGVPGSGQAGAGAGGGTGPGGSGGGGLQGKGAEGAAGTGADAARSGEICPQCGQGVLVKRSGKYGEFFGCSNFPTCHYTRPCSSTAVLTEEQKQYKCPRCPDGYFLKRENAGGAYWVCSNAPACNTKCSDVKGRPSIFSQAAPKNLT